MELVNNTRSGRYEAITKDFLEGAAPKEAGFRWDRNAVRWWTTDPAVAVRLASFADETLRTDLEKIVADRRGAIEASLAASRVTSADIEIPCPEGRAFLPYQKAGIAFALARKNVLIGDDMGLGKTAQAIGVVNADESLKRVLVICPASLKLNWRREFGMWSTRGLTVGIADSKTMPTTDVVIANYDLFSRKTTTADAIRAITWDALVLDEAHLLKSEDSIRNRLILGGRDKKAKVTVTAIQARRRIYLSGTPLVNRPVELWPLVSSLAPREFNDFFGFAKRYCGARYDGYGWDFKGASHLDELQDKLRSTVMVRRLKSDVLTELPAKRRQLVELPSDSGEAAKAVARERAGQQKSASTIADLEAKAELAKASEDPRAYERAVAALGAARRVAFEEISKVRHETALAKVDMVAEHVRAAVDGGSKVILFAHHRDVIEQLRTALADLGVVQITGDTKMEDRQRAVDAFQGNATVRVFIGNMVAAGVGLTLTASAHVIFAELDWVPGNISQCEDRAHRIGQRNSVLVQHLVLEGSIDAQMAAILIEKQRVLDGALDAITDPTVREARLAAEAARVADIEAIVAEAAMTRETREAARVAREQAQAERAASASDRQSQSAEEREDGAFERAATAHLTADQVAEEAEAMSPKRIATIHEGLRILKSYDEDQASEWNGVGYSKADTYIGHALAGRDVLTARQAVLGLRLVRRYRRQLPAELLATATGQSAPVAEPVVTQVVAEPEPITVPAVTQAPDDDEGYIPFDFTDAERELDEGSPPEWAAQVAQPASEVGQAATAAPVTKRGRGRPALAGAPMSQAERNKRWRTGHGIVALEIPATVAERIRRLREERGLSNADLLAAALDALAGQQATTPSDTRRLDA